jgi:serine O-acetyltransferase
MRTYELLEGSKILRIINCLRSPGVQVVVVMRLGQWSLLQPKLVRVIIDPIYFTINGILKIMWGIEIPRNARIGPGFYIGHFGGITISPYATLGRNCSISQQVTIGLSGQGEKSGAPTLGDNVYLAAGAKVFGKISIGNNVKIGANAVVHKSIPDRAIVVLNPGYQILPPRQESSFAETAAS